MTKLMPSPSDKEASKMKKGLWPQNDENGHNPFLNPINKSAQKKQEAGNDNHSG